MSIAADPRLRARHVEVARQAGRRRLAVVTGVLVSVAVVVTGLVGLHSSLLAARVVHIEGAVHETRGELLAVTGLVARPPLIDVSPGADETAIDRLPWVRSSRVVRDWPTGVTITVVERRPVAYMALSSQAAALVDSTGRVLSTGVHPPAGLVRLEGGPPPGSPGTRLRGARQALALASILPPALTARLASVGTRPGEGLVARLTNGPLVVFGSDASLPAKLAALETVLARLQLHGIVMIDLQVPSQPVLTR